MVWKLFQEKPENTQLILCLNGGGAGFWSVRSVLKEESLVLMSQFSKLVVSDKEETFELPAVEKAVSNYWYMPEGKTVSFGKIEDEPLD